MKKSGEPGYFRSAEFGGPLSLVSAYYQSMVTSRTSSLPLFFSGALVRASGLNEREDFPADFGVLRRDIKSELEGFAPLTVFSERATGLGELEGFGMDTLVRRDVPDILMIAGRSKVFGLNMWLIFTVIQFS